MSSSATNLDSRLVDANTKFAFKLFSQILKEDKNKNIFVSPTSVAIALSLLYQGADGKTQQEMAEALEFLGMSRSEINKANQTLRLMLANADPQVQLLIANSLWISLGFTLKPQFLENNQQFYDALVTELDFATPNAPDTINNWVKEKTGGKIPEIIQQLSPDDVLFLINAIYFKGNWKEKFDRDRTTKKPFYLSDGSTKEHPMMSINGNYPYYENSLFQGVSLPYGEGRISMYIFLPLQSSSLEDLYQQLTAENWNQWMMGFSSRDGSLELPRFQLEYELQLNNTLQALGMETMFDSGNANFSLMTPREVNVSEVKHKTFVEVNEEGTEAAAVTSIGIALMSAVISFSPPFRMVVDRPFFCAIRDDRTGTILFMGSIIEPE